MTLTEFVPALCRLHNDPAVDELEIARDRIHWKRGGEAPAVTRAVFELSLDGGKTWKPLDLPARGPSGWELNVPALAGSGIIRAQGQVTGFQDWAYGLVQSAKAFRFE